MSPMASTLTEQQEDLRTCQAHTALLGWSGDAIAGMRQQEASFLAVVPPDFEATMKESGTPYETWDFGTWDERSKDLAERLAARGVKVAVPLYEETVTWAGFVNGHLWDDPRQFRRMLLFRDKAMMKRMAQMHGLRVGVFEEVEDAAQGRRFVKRVQDALVKLESDEPALVHAKPLDAAGSVGHRVLRSPGDVDEKMEPDDFPCVMESHLEGQEFSCEVFVHDGKVRFLNITEYVHLGYSNFIPASPSLERHRPVIEDAVERLIAASGIRNGMLHPEFFVTDDGVVRFGEVAARVPGGHIFQLMQAAYGFDPYVGMAKCWDPDTSEEDLASFFPEPVSGARTFAGCLLVYPHKKHVESLRIPDELEEDPYFDGHTLVDPLPGKVPDRDGFGNHFGTVFLRGDDPDRMRELLRHYENVDFYA